MNKMKLALSFLAFVTFSLLLTSTAQALPRTYVAMNGADANTCAFNSPCLTFQGAHNKTDAGGEIIVLATGSYGRVTINKAISIIAPPGVHAEIQPGVNLTGVLIQAPAAAIIVLRNLYIVGLSTSRGIEFSTGKAIHVENCVINGFNHGIYVPATALVYVKDSTIRNSVGNGILLSPANPDSESRTQAFIEHCRFENYFQGVVAAGRYTTMTVRDSIFTGRSKDPLITYGGIIAAPTSVGTTHIMVENCFLSNNYLGIGTKTDGVAFISISQNVIYHNQVGVSTCCLSKMITFGNNRFEDNNDDGSFDLSTPLK